MTRSALPSGGLAGLVLGFGLGGFVDGIVAHQILEWHHMLTSWRPMDTAAGMRANMLGDGLFHAACLIVVLVGVYLLAAQPTRPTGRQLTGLLLAGWGIFNLIEGVVDHLILGVHHVREGSQELAYDLGFLVLGAALLAGGLWLARSPRRDAPLGEVPVARR